MQSTDGAAGAESVCPRAGIESRLGRHGWRRQTPGGIVELLLAGVQRARVVGDNMCVFMHHKQGQREFALSGRCHDAGYPRKHATQRTSSSVTDG